MPKGKYVHLAREFFDEGEINDMLSCDPPFSKRRILEIARSRGVFLSKDLGKDQLVSEVARYWYSWPQFRKISSYLDKEESEEKKTPKRIKNKVKFSEVEAAMNAVASERKDRESYQISKISEKKVRVTAKYIDRDPSRQKGQQRMERTVRIDVDLGDNQTELFFGRDDRSTEIAAKLISCMRKGRDNPDELDEVDVSLRGVSDPDLRTTFFTNLIRGLDGFRLEAVRDVKLHHRIGPDEEEEEESEEDELVESDKLQSRERDVAGKLETAFLHGKNILEIPVYADLKKDGYFICFARWEVREKGGKGRKVVLEAGFQDPAMGTGFFLDAKMIYEVDEYGDDVAVPRDTRAIEKAKFRQLLSEAAFSAYAEITIGDES
ncbi:MAG: hypothetical protein AAGC74_02680 [Verrucomicrobiota bacterium]